MSKIRSEYSEPFIFTAEERLALHVYETANGSKFTFRLGLEGGVGVYTRPSKERLRITDWMEATMEFTWWHSFNIRARLNGFGGYDLVKFSLFPNIKCPL